MNFPEKSVIHTKSTYDGHKVIDSINYQNNKGKSETVKFETNMDGERVPKVSRSIDGDYKYPNAKVSNSMW